MVLCQLHLHFLHTLLTVIPTKCILASSHVVWPYQHLETRSHTLNCCYSRCWRQQSNDAYLSSELFGQNRYEDIAYFLQNG